MIRVNDPIWAPWAFGVLKLEPLCGDRRKAQFRRAARIGIATKRNPDYS
jgi:hypothetical protein